MNSDRYNIEDEEEGSDPGSDGSQGREAWLKRLEGRMGDVRIHDSRQAGELVRRLGARAFTAGRDIYVEPELLRPFTRESAALLEHELFHVAEQTGASVQDMPLLRPSHSAGTKPGGAVSRGTQAVSTPSTAGSSMAPVQRYSAGQSSSEAHAEQREAGARHEQRREKAQKAPADPAEVADRVYELMLHELRLDNERGVD